MTDVPHPMDAIRAKARAQAPKAGRPQANAGTGNAAAKAATILVGLDQIEIEPINWIWKYFLARGKLHIIAGAPGDGKTTILLSWIAAISSGGMFPDGTPAPIGNCIIWTNEDGVADTIKPRLMRMNADMPRIKIVRAQRDKNGKVRPFNPATDMPDLIEAAKALGEVTFLMLDPVVAAVPMTRNGDKNQETRAGLQPVGDFAETLGAASFGVSHLTKGTSGKEPLERVTGSLAYGAVPRIVYLTAKNSAVGDDEPERLLIRAKNNIGPSGGGFGYHIDARPLLERPDIEATAIVWEHALEGTPLELMNAAEGHDHDRGRPKDRAKQFLREKLAGGRQMKRAIEAAAELAGIAWATVRRASDELEIIKWQEVKCWWWQLP
jgi:putative DNA primase/helicase